MFVSVKDRTYLTIVLLQHFGSIFAALFCLVIEKLILGCDTICQSMRKFLWAVWNASTFPHMDKEEIFLSG